MLLKGTTGGQKIHNPTFDMVYHGIVMSYHLSVSIRLSEGKLKFQIQSTCPSSKWIEKITRPNFGCSMHSLTRKVLSEIHHHPIDDPCSYSTCLTVISTRHTIFQVFVWFRVFCQLQNTQNRVKTWPVTMNLSYFLAHNTSNFGHGYIHVRFTQRRWSN